MTRIPRALLSTAGAVERRLFVLVSIAAIMASALLAGMYFVFVPMGPDGAWYSYPAYALSVGGDPSENIPDFHVTPAPQRPLAKFHWENRSNLTVPLTAMWYAIAGASWVSTRVFGVLHWLAISLLAGYAVWQLTKHRFLSITAGLVTLGDSAVIGESISAGRPDMPIVVVALALFVSLNEAFRTSSNGIRVVSCAFALALPLMHVTSANAIAFFLAFLALMWLVEREPRPYPATVAFFPLLVAFLLVAPFLLRQQIMDVIVPTAVPAALEQVGQHSLIGKLRSIVDAGGLWLSFQWNSRAGLTTTLLPTWRSSCF